MIAFLTGWRIGVILQPLAVTIAGKIFAWQVTR